MGRSRSCPRMQIRGGATHVASFLPPISELERNRVSPPIALLIAHALHGLFAGARSDIFETRALAVGPATSARSGLA